MQVVSDSAVLRGLACAERRGLISHVLATPLVYQSSFPKDSHASQLGASLQAGGGSAVFLEVIPFWFQFSCWGSPRVTWVYYSLRADPAVAAKTQPQRDDDLNLAGWLLVSRLPGTTQFGDEKNIPGSIHVYNCNEVRVSRCIPLKGLTQCSRKPFEVNKLFTFSKGDRNRKSSIVLTEIRMWDRPFSSREEVAVCKHTEPMHSGSLFLPGSLVHPSYHAQVPWAHHHLLNCWVRSQWWQLREKSKAILGWEGRDFEMLIFAFC